MNGEDIKLDKAQRARAVDLEPQVIDDPEWACAAIVWQRDQLADRDAEIVNLRAKLDSEASHRLSLCADNERFVAENAELRKARERAKPEIEKAVELIQRWGCECEPQIGFTCGPCRVVEIIDAAMGATENG